MKTVFQFVRNHFSLFFYLSLFLFIFAFNYSLPRDPDLGWHLRYGEETVFNKQISRQEQFTHTLKNQFMVDVEWLAEVIIYLVFLNWSFLGLALFSAVFTSMAFFLPAVVIKGHPFIKFFIIAWGLIASSPVLEIGARTQNVSWVFFSLLLLILMSYLRNLKWILLLSSLPLFLLWANLHPSFLLGLLLFFLFLMIEIIFMLVERRVKRSNKSFDFRTKVSPVIILLMFLAISFVVSGFRPKAIGSGGLLQLVGSLALPVNIAASIPFSGSVRVTIAEWLPPVMVDIPGTLFLLGLVFSVGVYALKPFTKDRLMKLLLLFGFIYFSTLARRNTPFFFLLFIPLMVEEIDTLWQGAKHKLLAPYLNILVVLLMFLVAVLRIEGTTKNILRNGESVEKYCEAMDYPCKAIEFIKKEKPPGNMFNPYNWGGYLIWQLKEYPVFIDGRVPGTKLFSEYETVGSFKEGWDKILEKYQVKWMFIYPNTLFQEILAMEGGWKEIYSDDKAVVIIKEEKK